MNKGKALVLLGAGASVEANVPDAFNLTRSVLSRASENYSTEMSVRPILYFVVGALLFRQGSNNLNPLSGQLNIEDLYNALELLANRDQSELAPFISAFSPMLSRVAEQRTEEQNTIALRRHLESLFSLDSRRGYRGDEIFLRMNSQTADQLIKDMKDVIHPGTKQLDQKLRDAMAFIYSSLRPILRLSSLNCEPYLAPILNRRKTSAVVSLNYDNVVELTAESAGKKIDTGIDAWELGSLTFKQYHLPLIKLHGSIDWHYTDLGRKITTRAAKGPLQPPALIFGGKNKLRADGPYLDLLMKFREFLMNSSSVTVCGYSFQDEHVNHFLLQWLERVDGVMDVVNGHAFDFEFTPANFHVMRRFAELRHKKRIRIHHLRASEGIRNLFGKKT